MVTCCMVGQSLAYFVGCDYNVDLPIGYVVNITSPGFPNDYYPNTSCRYIIKVPGEYQVQAVCDFNFVGTVSQLWFWNEHFSGQYLICNSSQVFVLQNVSMLVLMVIQTSITLVSIVVTRNRWLLLRMEIHWIWVSSCVQNSVIDNNNLYFSIH